MYDFFHMHQPNPFRILFHGPRSSSKFRDPRFRWSRCHLLSLITVLELILHFLFLPLSLLLLLLPSFKLLICSDYLPRQLAV